jgi:predicted ATPase/class 3 adenylate cyclase/tetratricopeptide (TPR) repeat protein
MTTAIPSGTVSFLFTDIEGSTRLWESDADSMGPSLELHDQIMRKAVASRQGHTFSTAGDAYAVAFRSVGDAIAAATQVQLDLFHAQWPGPHLEVRMGVHTGTAEERDGDYYGPVLNRAARIMSAGHGGQILLSSATAESVELNSALSLRDLGIHRLKDLEEPEHVFEVRHEDIPVVTTPIRTVDIRRHNLPDYLTTFVGRTPQLDQVASLIGKNRLVALTGVGGTGKTRLAVEVARSAVADVPDGAWLVELAPVSNPAFIMTTIGDTWGLRAGEGASIEDVVTRFLWSRDLLLIIDNCEHLLDGASAAIKLLLDACPKLRIVATSRESLGISGEAMLRVPSLGLPGASRSPLESEAALLFLDRARTARPEYDPSEEELADIGRICTRIDGIPLGLELAAARLRSMSTADLASRLDESFRILSGSAKAALPRQRTLHATVDWSYDLLKPEEQAMFRRLSVFAGGFDATAAESVCVGDEVEVATVLDHVDSLVDKSLVIPDHDAAGGTRYRLLEPVRQYAQERLSEAAEPHLFRQAHARHFVGLAALASPGLRGVEQVSWAQRIDADYDNIRTSFTTLLEAGALDDYLDLVFDLYMYWMQRGMQMEGIDMGLAGLSAAPDGTDPYRLAKVWYTTARFGAELTRPEGIEHARAGLAVAQTTEDPNLIGRLEMALGTCIRHATTDAEYLEHLLEGRRLLEAHPEPHWWEPAWERGLHSLLFAAYLPAEDERITEHLLTALEVFEESGDQMLLAATLADSAGMYGEGDRELDEWALANVIRACEIFSGLDSPNWYGHALYYRGILLRYERDYREAIESLEMGARRLEDVGDVNCWAGALRALARCEAALGDTDPAQEKLAAVIDRMPVLPMQEITKPRTLDAAAELFLAERRYDEAGITLGAALAAELPAEYGRQRDPELQEVRDQLVEVLGESEVEDLTSAGESLGLDEALARTRTWLGD